MFHKERRWQDAYISSFLHVLFNLNINVVMAVTRPLCFTSPYPTLPLCIHTLPLHHIYYNFLLKWEIQLNLKENELKSFFILAEMFFFAS